MFEKKAPVEMPKILASEISSREKLFQAFPKDFIFSKVFLVAKTFLLKIQSSIKYFEAGAASPVK